VESNERPLWVASQSERVVGVGIAAARDLLSEMALYRRQAIAVPSLSFGDRLRSCVAPRIGGVADVLWPRR